MQLIVLGMHRSGTSAVTRLLNLAGAYVGPEGSTTPPNEENPKGFWERRDVRAVCDALLRDSGFDWWNVADFDVHRLEADSVERHQATLASIVQGLDEHRPWVVKEPRLCLLLPVLAPLLEDPVVVTVTREPVEIARSLAARNGFPLSAGVALWERYQLHALESTAGMPRYHLSHADLLARPVETLDAVLRWLREAGVGGLRSPAPADVEAFIDVDLHRQRSEPDDHRELLNDRQRELATAVDRDELFGTGWSAVQASAGGTEALRALAETRLQEQELLESRARIRELDRTLDMRRETINGLREEVAGVQERVDLGERRADAARDRLDDATRDLVAVERSRAWRLAHRSIRLRQKLTPGMAPERRPAVLRARENVASAARALTGESARAPEGHDRGSDEVFVSTVGARTGGVPQGAKVAVVAWDVGHNPLGRAHTMAQMLGERFDVEILGAQFDRFGTRPWMPLREPDLPIRSFAGADLPEHVRRMEMVSRLVDADIVWVSKPRFPSLGLGALIKEHTGAPLVMDVDDRELSFFDETTALGLDELGRQQPADLIVPFDRAWTRACDGLVAEADAVTVSNVALREVYGGTIVPHSRDEVVFDPGRYDREATRHRLGIRPDERLLLFGGTPRVHKGVLAALRALERIGDPRYRLAVFETPELEQLRGAIGDLARWVRPLPMPRFDELAPLVGAADLSCVLQDPDHPVTAFQMPAKVTDALAMGVPCLVTDRPPLRPLIDADVVAVHDAGSALHERIAAIFDDPDASAARADRGRALFLAEYSHRAVSERVARVFDDALERGPAPMPRTAALVDVARRVTVDGLAPSPRTPREPGTARWKAAPGERYDLVMLWKQNDSSLYGRRQDMLLDYLQRSGRFDRIVHFDGPVSPEQLYGWYREGNDASDQRRLVVRQTLARLARRRDDGVVLRRTFLHGGRRSKRFGLPDRLDYSRFVSATLRRAGIGAERLTVFWVYPSNDDLPLLIDTVRPDLVVADVVDDNRTWYENGSPFHEKIEANYRDVLARSDVVVANCRPVADAMAALGGDVHVVPNGCEIPESRNRSEPPAELLAVGSPVIGYAGNLSDRLDLDLLDALAVARPSWQFTFVGSAHLDRSVMRLDRHANVHFLGVRPYDATRELIEQFDVAIIPHVDNDMTRSMNPLKAFVYAAAGVPIVSTPIANLPDLGQLVTVARDVASFEQAIAAALARGRQAPPTELLEPHRWERRVEELLKLVDSAAGVPGSGEPPVDG